MTQTEPSSSNSSIRDSVSAPIITTEPPKLSYPGKDLEAMDFALNYHNWVLDKFEAFIGSNLLEVGAGSGSLTKLLYNRFLKNNKTRSLLATEPSAQMFTALKDTLDGIDSRRISSSNHFLSEITSELIQHNIDTAIYINVMEHVEDDQLELDILNKILKPKGRVLTFSPAMPFLMSDFDRSIGHFRRYTLDEMKQKMTNSGFRIVAAYYMDLPGIIPWYLAFTLFKQKLTPGSTSTYDKLVVPILKVLEPNQILPFGKNILVVGEKN